MADGQDQFECTEEPSPKRREEARKKGEIASSRLMVPAATLIATALVLRFIGEETVVRLGRLFVGCFSLAGARHGMEQANLFSLSVDSGLLMAPVLAPLFLGVALAGVGSGLLQTGFLWTGETLRWDLSRINPLSGFRRMFSLDALTELGKSLLVLAAFGALGSYFLYDDLAALARLPALGVEEILLYAGGEGARLIGVGAGVMAAVAAVDYFVKRRRMETRLRMSRHELKEEMRESEGDPLTKSRIKGLRVKMSRRRMMADAAKADVVVTNPDHLAVALRYRAAESAAPRVVAKGAGFMAQKIKEIAAQNRIPVVENKPLARLLFKLVEVGQEIHESLYRAVAEVLAYVYRLRK